MNVFMSLYLAVLFVAFTPGVLVTLPKGGSKYTVLAVHAALFTLVWYFTHKTVWRMTLEGFQNNSMNMNTNAMNTNGMNTNAMNTNAMNTNAMNGNGMNAEGFQKKQNM
jgi:pentapeptide MXKDX repeat protein